MPNEIFKKMALVMSDVGAIAKKDRNQSQGFNFRGIDAVYNELHEVLAKHEVFTIPTVLSENSEERQTKNGGNLIYRILQIKYTFYTTDGSSVEAVVTGEGMDTGDKAANKAMAVAHKYALLQTFCIPTADAKDPDLESHEVSPKPTPAKPATALASAPEWFELEEEIVKSGKTVESVVKILSSKGVVFNGKVPDYKTFPLEYIQKIRNGLGK